MDTPQLYCPYEMSARRGKFQSVPFSGGAKSPSVQLPSRSGTRAATEESANLSACRRQPARGNQTGTPPESPERASQGRNRAQSSRRAGAEPARAFAPFVAAGAGGVRAGGIAATRMEAP